MHFSNYLEDEILDHILGTGAAFGQPSAGGPYGALHDDAPAETGLNELTGGSYARQQVAFGVAAGGTAANTAQEEWDLTGVTAGEVLFLGLWDAVSAGNFLWTAPVGGIPFTFTATDTGDLFTSYGHTLANDDRVILDPDPGSALPAGPSEDTVYWIVGVSGDDFQISTTQGGGALVLTSDGEGIAFFIDAKSFNPGDTFRVAAGDFDVFID